MRPLLPILLAIAAACSGKTPADVETPLLGPTAQETIALRNETAGPLVFLAAGEGTLALLDIPTTLPPGTFENRVVARGETRPIPVTDILGYDSKLGVNFFIWRVDRPSGAGVLAHHRLVSAAELEAARGVVRITTFAP
jgi:hypothetical protein